MENLSDFISEKLQISSKGNNSKSVNDKSYFIWANDGNYCSLQTVITDICHDYDDPSKHVFVQYESYPIEKAREIDFFYTCNMREALEDSIYTNKDDIFIEYESGHLVIYNMDKFTTHKFYIYVVDNKIKNLLDSYDNDDITYNEIKQDIINNLIDITDNYNNVFKK